jgi:hypothetical protein
MYLKAAELRLWYMKRVLKISAALLLGVVSQSENAIFMESRTDMALAARKLESPSILK